MTVANRKTVSGFLHVSWRTAGAVARRIAERVKASMSSPFDGLTAVGVDGTGYRKGHAYLTVFCQVVIGQCGVSFPSEKAVGFSPVRNWPVIARVLLFHCIRA